MQTLVDIEENQLHKLLFYTHTDSSAEAVAKIIQDYLSQQDLLNQQAVSHKKSLLQTIQNRFSSIPATTSLADELIAERRPDALQELK